MYFASAALFLLGLAALPLLAIYMLRKRAVRLRIPALFLWEKTQTPQQAGSRLKLLLPPLRFWLELAALLLLAAAAARPFFFRKDNVPPIAAVLDNSFSMLAVQPDGIPLRDNMLRELAKRFSSGKRRVLWILAGETPMLQDSALPPSAFWDCNSSTADLAAAVALAAESASDGDILVITDRKPDFPLPENLEWISNAEPMENMALVNAKREENSLLLEVQNFTGSTRETRLDITSLPPEIITVGKGQRIKLLRTLPEEMSSKPVTAELHYNDALEADNKAVLLPEERRPLSFRLDAGLTEKQAALLGKTLLRNPDYISLGDREIVFGADIIPPGNYHRFFWHSKEDAAIPTHSGIAVRPGFAKLTRGLSPAHLKWPCSQTLKMQGEPVLWMDNIPLLTLEKRGAFYDFHLNLHETAGNLPASTFWPVFFWNMSDYLRELRPGPININCLAGELLTVNTAEKSTAVSFDGTSVTSAEYKASLKLEKPGIFTIKAGESTWQIAVNRIAAKESDLSVASPFKRTPPASVSAMLRNNPAELDYCFVLAALALLVLTHWYTTRRP